MISLSIIEILCQTFSYPILLDSLAVGYPPPPPSPPLHDLLAVSFKRSFWCRECDHVKHPAPPLADQVLHVPLDHLIVSLLPEPECPLKRGSKDGGQIPSFPQVFSHILHYTALRYLDQLTIPDF